MPTHLLATRHSLFSFRLVSDALMGNTLPQSGQSPEEPPQAQAMYDMAAIRFTSLLMDPKRGRIDSIRHYVSIGNSLPIIIHKLATPR